MDAAGTHLVVIGASPSGVPNRLSGELVEGLADEVRAGEATVDEARLATFLSDGRDAGMALQGGSRIPAGAIGTQGDHEARGIDGSGSGETFKQFVFGMSGKL